MAKTIFIKDVIAPSAMGRAISTTSLINDYVNIYNTKIIRDIKWYTIKEKNMYYIHVLVPSTKNEDYENPVFYDVLIQFYPVKKENQYDTTVNEYGIKVYSNVHSWIYNFTYTFNKNNCIPDIIPKNYLSPEAIKKSPDKTNPLGLFGIDRIVFIALYHIQQNTNFRKNRLDLMVLDKKKPSDLLTTIMSQQDKLDEVEIEQKRLRIKKQGIRAKEKKRKSVILAKKNNQHSLLSRLQNSALVQNIEKSVKSGIKEVGNMKQNFSSSLKRTFGSSVNKKK